MSLQDDNDLGGPGSRLDNNPAFSQKSRMYRVMDSLMIQFNAEGDKKRRNGMAERMLLHLDLPIALRIRALIVLATNDKDPVSAEACAREAVRLLDEEVRPISEATSTRFPQLHYDQAQRSLQYTEQVLKRYLDARKDDGYEERVREQEELFGEAIEQEENLPVEGGPDAAGDAHEDKVRGTAAADAALQGLGKLGLGENEREAVADSPGVGSSQALAPKVEIIDPQQSRVHERRRPPTLSGSKRLFSPQSSDETGIYLPPQLRKEGGLLSPSFSPSNHRLSGMRPGDQVSSPSDPRPRRIRERASKDVLRAYLSPQSSNVSVETTDATKKDHDGGEEMAE